MAIETAQKGRLEAVVRALTAAGKSLRLYPASSPIPRQSLDAAATAVAEYFDQGEPVIALALGREGFVSQGEPIAAGVLGVDELAGALRSHGAAEVAITPGCSVDELLGLMTTLARPAEEVRAEGGLATALVSVGVESIRVTDVQLTVLDQVGPAEDEDLDDFLRSLAGDPDRLSAWFASAAGGDPHAFEESLMELVRVSGPSGFPDMLGALSQAFGRQDQGAKDVLLGLAIDDGPTRDLTGSMFGLMNSNDIAGSVIGGTFGKNMLSLSTALTRLPLEQVTAAVRAEVQTMLPTMGHSTKESEFLDHMIDVRTRTEPEAPLADRESVYRSVIEATRLSEEMIAQARGAVTSSGQRAHASSVRTMLTLLDQQRDFALFCDTASSLAALVPVLVEQGDLETAARVVTELAARESMPSAAWPELPERLREALAVAAGPRTMKALVRLAVDDPSKLPAARQLVRHAGDQAATDLVLEAVSLKAPGLAVAEDLLGRRVVDVLAQNAGQLQWFQVAPVAARLAREGDGRSTQVLESLLRRPDEQSRREVVTGLAEAGGPVASRLLGLALRDKSPEVAIVAARTIGKAGQPGSVALLAGRLSEIDVDNADFALARELIAALARVPDPAADEALAKLASRRALIKRGHFAEVQDLARQAIEYRAKSKGGVR